MCHHPTNEDLFVGTPVVGMKLAGCQHMPAHGIDQRREEITRSTDPTGKRGAIEVDSFAGVDLRLPVQRLMIGVLRYQHMRQQPRTGEPAIDGA